MNNEQLNAEKRKMISIWDTVSSALLILGLIGSPFSGFFLGMRIYSNGWFIIGSDAMDIIIDILFIIALICPVVSLIISIVEAVREYKCKWAIRNIILSIIEIALIAFFAVQGFYGTQRTMDIISSFQPMTFG